MADEQTENAAPAEGSTESAAPKGPLTADSPVSDAFVPDYPTIALSKTIGDAYDLMVEKSLDALPIAQDDGKVVRVISRNDVEIIKSVFFEAPGFEERRARIMCLPLTEVNKTQQLASVKDDVKLAEALPLMAEKGFLIIPVLKSDGTLAGVVTARHVLKSLIPSS